MPQKPMGPGDHLTPKNCTNIIHQLAMCHATCFHVFLRKDFGDEAFGGLTGPGAFILMVIMAGSDRIMLMYFWVWLCALLMQRARSTTNRWKGIVVHSKCNGYAAVAMKLFRVRSEPQARKLEPLLNLMVGIPMLYVSDVAGKFIALGAVSMWFVEGTIRWTDRRKMQAMRDAQIDAQRISGYGQF